MPDDFTRPAAPGSPAQTPGEVAATRTPSLGPATAGDARGPTPDGTVAAGPPGTTPSGLVAIRGYEVLGEIGRGGMGVVYSARDLALDREVAIKTTHPHAPANGPIARRFLSEARIAARLEHPGIPPVHAVGELPDGRPYMVTKRVRGRVLTEVLATLPLSIEGWLEKMSIFERVCETVGFAHARGVVHRDLKPSNVMIGEFGEVNVMDWGLAKVTGSSATGDDAPDPMVTRVTNEAGLTMAGDVFGTPGYMPPEQARGEWDVVDARADVFALGSILVVLLTGQPAYTGETTEEVLRRSAAGEHAELLERIARAVRYDRDYDPSRVALDCLATDPSRRPPTATALLQRIRSDAATAVRGRKERQRSLFLVASAAMLTLLGAVASVSTFAAERVYRQTTEDASREVDGTLTRTAWYGKGAVERALQDHVAFVEEHARVNPELRDRLAAAADAAAAAGGDAARAHDLIPDRAAFDALVAHVHGDAQKRWPAVEGRAVALLVVTGDTPAGGPARGFTLAREKAGVPAGVDRADPSQAKIYRTDWSFYDSFTAGGNRFDEQDRPHPVVRRTHISQTYQPRGDGRWRLDVVTPVWAADGRVAGLLSVGLDVNRHLRNLIEMPDALLSDRQHIARALDAFVVNDRGALVWHERGTAAPGADAARTAHRDPENLPALARRLGPAHGRHPDDLVPWASAARGVEDGPDRYVDPVALGTPAGGAPLLAHTLTFHPFAHSRYAEGRGRAWGFVAQVPEATALAPVERLRGQLVWSVVIFVFAAAVVTSAVWLWLFLVVGK